jgi:hypothetical protein
MVVSALTSVERTVPSTAGWAEVLGALEMLAEASIGPGGVRRRLVSGLLSP